MPTQDTSSAFAVIIDVTVYDESALFKAALERYCKENDQCANPEEDALDLLKPGGDIDVSACLQMLFDPGLSPPGCQIEQSSIEDQLHL